MDQLSEILQPHKDLIGKVAAGVTFLQMLSGAAVCNTVRKQGSVENVAYMLFLGGILIGVVSLRLGQIIGDENLTTTHAGGLILNFVYLYILYFYSTKDERKGFWREVRICTGITGILLIYSYLENADVVEFRLNMVLTIFLTCLVASPLMHLPEIIRTKDSAKLQFPVIASGSAVGFMWFLYGICLKNSGMIMQTSILLGLSVIQLTLCFMYPAKPISAKKKQN